MKNQEPCPYCGAEDIEHIEYYQAENRIEVRLQCECCAGFFREFYTFSGTKKIKKIPFNKG